MKASQPMIEVSPYPLYICGGLVIIIVALYQVGVIDPFGMNARTQKAKKAKETLLAKEKAKQKKQDIVKKATEPRKGKAKGKASKKTVVINSDQKAVADLLKEIGVESPEDRITAGTKKIPAEAASKMVPQASTQASPAKSSTKTKKNKKMATPIELLDALGASESVSCSDDEVPVVVHDFNPIDDVVEEAPSDDSASDSPYVAEDFPATKVQEPEDDFDMDAGWTVKVAKGAKAPKTYGTMAQRVNNAKTRSTPAANQRILPGNLTAVVKNPPKPSRPAQASGRPTDEFLRTQLQAENEPTRGPAWNHAPREEQSIYAMTDEQRERQRNVHRKLTKDEEARTVRAAVKAGNTAKYSTLTKTFAGAGGQRKENNVNYARIADEDDGHYGVGTTSRSLGKAIMQHRMALGMTQKDLAIKINEKPSVIQDYECGRAIPNGMVNQKLSRALGNVKLPKNAK